MAIFANLVPIVGKKCFATIASQTVIGLLCHGSLTKMSVYKLLHLIATLESSIFLVIDEYCKNLFFVILLLKSCFHLLFQMQAHGVHTEGDVVYVPFPLDCKYGE